MSSVMRSLEENAPERARSWHRDNRADALRPHTLLPERLAQFEFIFLVFDFLLFVNVIAMTQLDLDRMLENCRRDQWSVGDLDWSRKPRTLSRENEMAVVQLFTDMAGIERLAGALFRENQRRVDDPILKDIFATFVKDELRHSHAAQMLADFYDVHHYREYSQSPSLRAFVPWFLDAVQYLSDDVANTYITAGELILDIALLRSIDDFVDDEMSHEAMRLINRDESRHIAIDYYMSEYYGSDAYNEKVKTQKKMPADQYMKAAWTFTQMLYHGEPFIRDVFLNPMAHLDPQGKRLKDAFKRLQLLGMKAEQARRPFNRFLRSLQGIFNHPVAGPLAGDVVGRIVGVGSFLERFYTEEELRRARSMSYADMAREALEAKNSMDI